MVMCHCKACQRRTGSAFGLGVYFSPDQVSVSGATKSFSRPTDSGEELVSNFCPRCGTTVFWKIQPEDGRIGIAGGAFEGSELPAPERSVWEQSKHPWLNVESIAAHFPQGR